MQKLLAALAANKPVDAINAFKASGLNIDEASKIFYRLGGNTMWNDILKTATTVGSFISGLASGGYTGAGGKYEPAAIVHKGEYVIPKKDVNQTTGLPKPEKLEQLKATAVKADGRNLPHLNRPQPQIAPVKDVTADKKEAAELFKQEREGKKSEFPSFWEYMQKTRPRYPGILIGGPRKGTHGRNQD